MADAASVTTDGLSVSLAWQLEEPLGDVHEETYKKAVRQGIEKICKDHGGVENYLRVRFQEQEQLRDWLNYLVHLVPLDVNPFNFSSDLPSTRTDSLKKVGCGKSFMGSNRAGLR